MTVRKSLSRLSPPERDAFLEAVLTLKNTIANPGSPNPISVYDQFVAMHYGLTRVIDGMGVIDLGHGVSWFLSWHRQYIRAYELALQSVNPNVALPYWDWTDHTGTTSIVFQDNFIGPDGSGAANSVSSGYFAYNAPAVLPPWWPAGLPGWRIRADLDSGPDGLALTRNLLSTASLANFTHMQTTLQNAAGLDFWLALEGGPRMHNDGHNWVRGHMLRYTSPNDPIFFCHHANVDRIWAMWQIDGHAGAPFFPSGGGLGWDLTSPMWPWDAGANSVDLPATVEAPDFSSDPPVTTSDTLDHRAMGYSYDTEPVVGVLIDRSGSMSGPTPHPLIGAPDVTKWEAASLGVEHFLIDCEAAYDAREAYVTAGVETFTTVGGASTFDKVFPAPHFGLVKAGGTVDAAGFVVAAAGLAPAGLTPIGGGMQDIEATIVRPPFGNQPAGEQRYMCVLTDGHENVAPLLASLGTPEFPDTAVFAMGFGIGGGVTYAMINTMVTKGKTLPGVGQVFHGESAGEIDKFYANSVAAAIGYTPMIDPTVELFPGEFVMIPFYVNDIDNHLMITVQGHNGSEDDWRVMLKAPNGETYHGDVDAPISLSTTAAKGRTTMFLKVREECCEQLIGPWNVMVSYRMSKEQRRMVMPSPLHMLKPSGSLPLHGQIYSARTASARRRRLHRGMLFSQMALPAAVPPGRTPGGTDPSAVTVQVYTKHHGLVSVASRTPVVKVGEEIDLRLDMLSDPSLRVDVGRVMSRVVAPAFDIGEAFADIERFPLAQRKKFVPDPTEGKGEEPAETAFRLADFLAAYEEKRPDFFGVRDELVEFSERHPAQRLAVLRTEHEGAHKIGIHVEGEIEMADGRRQRFSRVLSHTTLVAPVVDDRTTEAVLHWFPRNRFVAVVSPRNPSGGPVNPLSVGGTVTFGSRTVAGTTSIQPDGSVHVAGALPGRMKVNESGRISEGGRSVRPTIDLLGSEKRLVIPKYVGNRETHRMYGSGTTAAKKLSMAETQVFNTLREAREAGFES